MNDFNALYFSDMRRYGKNGPDLGIKKVHYFFRKAQTTKERLLKMYYRWRFARVKKRLGLELHYNTRIGPGLYLGHPYNITINPETVIGSNVNLHKGVTIGQENRGCRKGVPTIGNSVWIGINATVVGKIRIGSDVLIAPNSFVNCDVPDHSVVFGNPCVIKPCEEATKDYICNLADV